MALLHRDRPETATSDTVAGAGTADRPAWPRHAGDTERGIDEPVVVRRNSFGQTLRTVLATILLVAIVVVAAANTDEVGVDLVVEEYDPPLSALVGGAAGAGFLVGALLMWGRHRRHRF